MSCGDPGTGFDAGVGGGAGGSGGGSGGGGSGADGLPCNISAIVGAYCVRCHASPTINGAPVSLVTLQDFHLPSGSQPLLNNAQQSLVRVNSVNSPMPPLPYARMSAAEIQAFNDWVNADAPGGSCTETPDAGSTTLPPAQTTCASNSFWNFGTLRSANMNPGLACRSCHLGDNFQNQNPSHASEPFRAYFFMGTAFTSLHEKDTCNANPASGIVEILDATGTVKLRLGLNGPSGNFFSSTTTAGFAMPYTARVIANGKTTAMGTKQTDGDCNTCHTEQGLNGAPGRIVIPK